MPSLDAQATAIAEAVTAAWWRAQGGSLIEIPLGVVAALALTRHGDPNRPGPAQLLPLLDRDKLVELLREIWLRFTVARPELSIRVGPFAAWLDDPTPAQAGGAHAAALAAVKAGQFDLTGDLDHLAHVDLLGRVYTALRSPQGRKAHGEIHTPTHLADLLAAMTLGTPHRPPAGPTTAEESGPTDGTPPGLRAGQVIAEPSAGTGGLLRAAALHLRRTGADPHELWWLANDIDPIAVAALAVNAHLWNLGPRVILGVADTLSEPDWHERAEAEQQRAIDQHNQQVLVARILVAERLLTRVADESATTDVAEESEEKTTAREDTSAGDDPA